jgi:TRAP-type C4-dicarboxylate transport system permease small subunit
VTDDHSASVTSRGFLARADQLGRLLENSALVGTLSAMILLASTQIILRNFLDSGIAWADEALRLMVLWVAMLGAVAASRDNRHISIDILSKVLPVGIKRFTALIVHGVTAGVCGLLAFLSAAFVSETYQFDDRLLDNIPAWWFQAILPVAFSLMAYRYCLWCVKEATALLKPERDAE